MTLEQMKAMKLHEHINIDKWSSVLRVPNGWLYCFEEHSVFVPEVLPIIQHVEPRK